MAVIGDNAQASNKAKSKLIAVPSIPFRPRQLSMTPETSSSLTVESSHRSASQIAPQTITTPGTLSTNRGVAKKLRDSESEASKTSSERVKWEYDVYAAPFIPSTLTTINQEEPGSTITTRSRHRIDYQTYTASFVGSSFLPDRTIYIEEDDRQSALPGERLTVESYLLYFTALWRMECAAKEKENKGYALYKTPLYHTPTPDGQSLWALSVPGLREDSPFVEMGDSLQLRQLWVDGAGNIVQVPMQVNDPGFAHVRFDYKSWTGVQHDTVVYSVNRAQEVVYLKADGLSQLYAGHSMVPIMANISFPLKQRLLQAQRKAILCVNEELKKTGCLNHHPAQNGLNGDFDHFNKSPGVNYASTDAAEKQARAPHNDWICRILFPTETNGLLQTQLRDIPNRRFFEHKINYEQAHAINSVCANDYGTLPYLISGPPGTGKTKTLVETAMQFLDNTDVAHILICAPSEAAADTLALRLKQYLSTQQLFRLNRPGRTDNEVPRVLMQYCYVENDMFYLPPFKILMAYNVIVTSCQDAAILAEARLTNIDLWEIERNMFSAFHLKAQAPTPSLHWGALLIDEAAQATEIDILPAISVVCPSSNYPTSLTQPRFVMAGDENQLGPRTASRNPQYSTSLFARLFDRSLYKNHPLSRSNIKPSSGPPVLKKSMLPIIYPPFTNLIRNYRSHPSILSVPSSLFYNDTLIPEAQTLNTPLQQSLLWRGRRWPVLFLPHIGLDEIECDGGGWYNVSEARLACSIAQTLIYNSKVKQADICIMSPFAAQVKLLRSLIRSNEYGGGSGLWDVNIGPLEAFQGLESRIVIICTTRTRDRFLDMDAKRGLGIVHQKRKMNVALTRAKEALFVIGNPAVLRQDEHWKQWLAFCWRSGLVSDPQGVWNAKDEKFGEERVGVLERALVAKEDHRGKKGKALGVGSAGLDMNADYEAWIESLREALDEEEDEEEEDEEQVDETDDGNSMGSDSS